MLFNSFEFLLFLPLVLLLHWFVACKNGTHQNVLLLIASYVFYAWWDWRFLFLIILSSLTDYFVGLGLTSTRTHTNRKILLGVSLVVNLGILGFFKYYNFFIQELAEGLGHLNIEASFSSLNIILPVGVSFYTFQTMAYSIDVYRKDIKPERNLIQYLTFVSFFPQLVAGPIERSKNLLPQFGRKRYFNPDLANEGLRQMLWGFFAKLVVAENIAPFVEDVFTNFEHKSSSTLVIGAFLFAIQVYADFSGYSNIAIGTAKLFGIRLSINFRYPIFARNISEFWQRWHISLTHWCRDYIYKPMGGGRLGKKRQFVNVLVLFLVMGLWHGANWTFLIFGLVHGLYFLVPVFLGSTTAARQVSGFSLFPSLKELFQMVNTFLLFSFSVIPFRSDSLANLLGYYSGLFSGWDKLDFAGTSHLLFWSSIFIGAEWVQRRCEHALDFKSQNRAISWIVCSITIVTILFYGEFGKKSFIYFQF